MDDTTNCKKCHAEIDALDVFPGHICVACHAVKFDKQVEKNGGLLPRPNFSNVFRSN